VDESYAQIGNNDFKTTIIKLKQQNVDAVFLDMVANDPINFLRQAKQLDFKPRVITYNGTLDSFSNESDKSLLDGVIILNWEIVSDQFSEMFQKEYSKQATKSVDKYFDSIYVMAQSIANSSQTSEVNHYIIDNTFTTPNSTISFTQDHAVKDINVRMQIMKDGVLKDW
jgi:ABC-type branched-subunit amino acid transport system substrate-binding protein